MKVHIEGSIYIESDERQFIIKEYTGKQNEEGKELYKVHGYFGNLSSAVKKLIKMKLLKTTVATLEELLQETHAIRKEIESKLTI